MKTLQRTRQDLKLVAASQTQPLFDVSRGFHVTELSNNRLLVLFVQKSRNIMRKQV